MMKNFPILLFLLILLGSYHSLKAQDTGDDAKENTFDLSAQLRSRFELRDGNFRPLAKKEKPAALVLNRVRLNLGYEYKDILKTKFTLQNVNIWGQANPMQVNDKSGNDFSVFEAWAAVKIVDSLWLKAGRQVISYEDERLFSSVDWANSGRSHDALSLHYNKKRFNTHAFFAFNQNYAPLYGNNVNNPSGNLYNISDAQNYKTMQTIWAAYQTDQHSHISYLFSNIGFQNAITLADVQKTVFLQTTGLFYDFNYPKVFGNVSGYYQFGRSLTSKKNGAFLLSANIGTPLSEKVKLSIGSDYVSGNKSGNPTSVNKAFQPLYGTPHKFYGSMDYFVAMDNGLSDNHLTLFYTASPKIGANLTGHFFAVPTKLDGFSRNLGQEIDAQVDFKLQKFVTLNMGYSTYFTTKTLLLQKDVSNAKSLQQWFWVSLNVTPRFFNTKF